MDLHEQFYEHAKSLLDSNNILNEIGVDSDYLTFMREFDFLTLLGSKVTNTHRDFSDSYLMLIDTLTRLCKYYDFSRGYFDKAYAYSQQAQSHKIIMTEELRSEYKTVYDSLVSFKNGIVEQIDNLQDCEQALFQLDELVRKVLKSIDTNMENLGEDSRKILESFSYLQDKYSVLLMEFNKLSAMIKAEKEKWLEMIQAINSNSKYYTIVVDDAEYLNKKIVTELIDINLDYLHNKYPTNMSCSVNVSDEQILSNLQRAILETSSEDAKKLKLGLFLLKFFGFCLFFVSIAKFLFNILGVISLIFFLLSKISLSLFLVVVLFISLFHCLKKIISLLPSHLLVSLNLCKYFPSYYIEEPLDTTAL